MPDYMDVFLKRFEKTLNVFCIVQIIMPRQTLQLNHKMLYAVPNFTFAVSVLHPTLSYSQDRQVTWDPCYKLGIESCSKRFN